MGSLEIITDSSGSFDISQQFLHNIFNDAACIRYIRMALLEIGPEYLCLPV